MGWKAHTQEFDYSLCVRKLSLNLFQAILVDFVSFPHKCLDKYVKDRTTTVLATSHFAVVFQNSYGERWKNSVLIFPHDIVEYVNKHNINSSINVGSKTINSNIALFIHAPVHCWELDHHIYHSYYYPHISNLA